MILPFEWWMAPKTYQKLNRYVMSVIYTPFLLVTATIETRDAHRVLWNRRHGEADDDDVQEWENSAQGVDFEADDTWKEIVSQSQPNVHTDPCILEVRALKKQVAALAESVRLLTEKNGPAPSS